MAWIKGKPIIDIDEKITMYTQFVLLEKKKKYYHNRRMDWWQDKDGQLFRFVTEEDRKEMARKKELHSRSITPDLHF